MDLKEIEKEVDSIQTDLQKFNGNPFLAIVDAWDKKVDVLIKYNELFNQEFINELVAFKLKVHEKYPNQPTDIGNQLDKLRKSIKKNFEDNTLKKCKPKINNKLIQSVGDAINSVHLCGFEKGQLIFRGQSNSDWDINPILFRKYPKFSEARMFETTSLGPIFLNLKSPLVHSYDPIEHLLVAQHFGMPTRLVDWTNDILVGLFFACYDPNKEQSDKNGRLTLAERNFFKSLKINSIDQKIYKGPIDLKDLESHQQRFNINDISIIEPLIKNPRMRVQDGCFMFFPWKFNSKDDKLLTLNKYIREQRKFVDDFNSKNDEKCSYIFVAHRDVDKNYKHEIITELDEVYGISEETLFINSNHTKATEKFFSILNEHAKVKTEKLSQK